MAIQGVVFSNQKVSAADHAALFEMFVSDGVINGCATSQLRNTLTIASGMFVLKGRLIKIAGSEQITVPDSMIPSSGTTTIRLTGVVDISLPSTQTEFEQFYFRLDPSSGGSYPTLKQESINTGNGHIYEVEWAILTINNQGVITNVNVSIGESEGGSQGGGGSSSLTANDFSFPAGKYLFASSGDNWELAFTDSGTLSLNKNLTGVDIFVIGAGQAGVTSDSESSNPNPTNHDGGSGGYYKNFYNDSLKAGSYNVRIGQASRETSSIGDRTATSSDQYKVGGRGAVREVNGENGTAGEYAFGSSTSLISSLSGRKYGASGGGGAQDYQGYDGRAYNSAGAGADYGSGAGGNGANSPNGGNALANSGSGGGGRGLNFWADRLVNGDPGTGGSGIIIIRNSRS